MNSDGYIYFMNAWSRLYSKTDAHTVDYRRIVGRLISKVKLFKPSFFVSSYGTELMFSFVV